MSSPRILCIYGNVLDTLIDSVVGSSSDAATVDGTLFDAIDLRQRLGVVQLNVVSYAKTQVALWKQLCQRNGMDQCTVIFHIWVLSSRLDNTSALHAPLAEFIVNHIRETMESIVDQCGINVEGQTEFVVAQRIPGMMFEFVTSLFPPENTPTHHSVSPSVRSGRAPIPYEHAILISGSARTNEALCNDYMALSTTRNANSARYYNFVTLAPYQILL